MAVSSISLLMEAISGTASSELMQFGAQSASVKGNVFAACLETARDQMEALTSASARKPAAMHRNPPKEEIPEPEEKDAAETDAASAAAVAEQAAATAPATPEKSAVPTPPAASTTDAAEGETAADTGAPAVTSTTTANTTETTAVKGQPALTNAAVALTGEAVLAAAQSAQDASASATATEESSDAASDTASAPAEPGKNAAEPKVNAVSVADAMRVNADAEKDPAGALLDDSPEDSAASGKPAETKAASVALADPAEAAVEKLTRMMRDVPATKNGDDANAGNALKHLTASAAASATHPASGTAPTATGASLNLNATQAALTEPVKTVIEPAVHGVRFLVSRGEETLSVRLSPASLGELKIEVTSRQDGVDVRIVSPNAFVRNALHEDLALLRTSLAREGIDANRIVVASTSAQSSFSEQSLASRQNHLDWQGSGQAAHGNPSYYGGENAKTATSSHTASAWPPSLSTHLGTLDICV